MCLIFNVGWKKNTSNLGFPVFYFTPLKILFMDFNFCGKLKKNNGKKTQLAYYVMNYVEYGELFR